MKGLKKTLLLALPLTLLLAAPALGIGTFSDVEDSQTAEYVEILQTMGIVGGVTSQRFAPDEPLSRAQFTKMAVVAMGKGDAEQSNKRYTIFPDVPASHWASGYINVAVRGEKKFIAGFADGSFGPEKNIRYGEAVTILMRLLGYQDKDVGFAWPSGYLDAAAKNGLTKGLSLGGEEALTRAEAAHLFVNLMQTNQKDTEKRFAESIAATVQTDTVLMNATARAVDGSPALETTSGTHVLKGNHAPTMLQGRRGTLLLDAAGKAFGFLPADNIKTLDITVSSARSGSIIDLQGKSYDVNATIKTYDRGKETTYGEAFVNLRSGTRVTLHVGQNNKVELIFIGESAAARAIVIERDGDDSRVKALTGGRNDYRIYRRGEIVTPAALRAYDVATYNPADNIVTVSTFRLTGRYNNAYPNTEAPTSISVFGRDFEVLPAAVSDLSTYKLGQQVTLLLTQDAQVAGVVNPIKMSHNAVGVAQVADGTATVTLLDGLVLKGKYDGDVKLVQGELVRVSSQRADYLSLSPLRSDNSGADTLNVATRQLGKYSLSANVQLFERAGKGAVAAISLDEIRLSEVPAKQILYADFYDGGKIGLLVLDNVTGDRFTYGTYTDSSLHIPPDDPDDEKDHGRTINRITVHNATGAHGPYEIEYMPRSSWIGVAADTAGTKVAGTAELKPIPSVKNAAWETERSVYYAGVSYAVSDEVACYNRTTGKWVTLSSARAFGDRMTLYVDDFNVVRGIEVGG